MNNLFLFDLDNTLFDSATYRKKLFNRIVKDFRISKNITFDFLQAIYNKQIKKSGMFVPEIFLQEAFFGADKKISKKQIRKLIYDRNFLHDNFHSDVFFAFESLFKHGEIGIFSQGELKLQRAKISKFSKFLSKDKIHITSDKKSQLKKIFQRHNKFKIYFIDDMLPILIEAKKQYPSLSAILIKRRSYANDQNPVENFSPDATVDTLHKAVDFIKSTLPI